MTKFLIFAFIIVVIFVFTGTWIFGGLAWLCDICGWGLTICGKFFARLEKWLNIFGFNEGIMM